MSQISDLDYLAEKGLSGYKPHQEVLIEKNSYIIKVAQSPEELIKTFALRYEVYGPFYKTKPPKPLDIDAYDASADHIIVMDKDTQNVLGTYRVLCSDFVDEFYTEREFNLKVLKESPDRYIEMGRATVSSEARSGVVINLLWRGLGEYIKNIKADYLLGCATLWTEDFDEAAKAWAYFKNIGVFFDKEITPLEENNISNWSDFTDKALHSEKDLKEIGKNLPPLIKSYIKAKARFAPIPAHDKKLQAVDFFTICKVAEMSGNLVKKYL